MKKLFSVIMAFAMIINFSIPICADTTMVDNHATLITANKATFSMNWLDYYAKHSPISASGGTCPNGCNIYTSGTFCNKDNKVYYLHVSCWCGKGSNTTSNTCSCVPEKRYQCSYCSVYVLPSEKDTHTHYIEPDYGYNGTESTFYAYPINTSAGDGCTLTTNMTYSMAAEGASVKFTVTKPGARKAVLTIDGTEYELTTTSTSTSKSITMPASAVTATVEYDWLDPEYIGEDVAYLYDAGIVEAPITTTSTGTKTYTSSNENVATIDASTGETTIVGPGVTTITLSTGASSTTRAGSKSIVLTVNKKTPEFTGSNITKSYGESSFSSGLLMTNGNGEINYSSSDTSVATIDNSGNVSIVGGGTTTLTISSTETSEYNAGSKSVILTVNRIDSETSLGNIAKTYGDSQFAISYTTTGDGAVTYTSSNTNVATIDASGNVSIKNAGTTTITVNVAQGKNYNASSAQATLTVNKATPTINSLTASGITYGQSLASSTLTHIASTPGSVAWQDDTIKPSVSDSNTTNYTVVFTPTDTANYNSTTKTTTVSVAKRIPTFTPEQLATVKASGITYGQSLASSTLSGTGPVKGTFTWQDSSIKPSVSDSNTTNYNVVFTPTDTANYTAKVIQTKLTVTKKTPVFTTEQLATVKATGIVYGQSLSSSTLSGTGPVAGTFSWQDSSIKPSVADSNTTKYNVVFTPNDTVNYTTKVIQASLAVVKATPTVNSLTASGITYGQSLANSTLTHTASAPGTVAWQDSSIKPTVADSNTTNYTVVFTPTDTVNYNSTTKTTTVSVSKQTPTFTPEQLATVKASAITYEQSLASSTLVGEGPVPGNFTWKDNTIKPSVSDSKTTKYKVIFTPDDIANYNSQEIEVTVEVVKATPLIENLQATKLVYGQSLGNSTLSYTSRVDGSVNWKNRNIKPSVSDSKKTEYEVIFTPTDTANYNTVDLKTTVEIIKANPVVTNATASAITYGQSLADSTITYTSSVPGNISWLDNTVKPTVSDSGTTIYTAVFAPTDYSNYNSVTVGTTLIVNKATPVINSLSATGITYGQSLADSVLSHTATVPGSVAWQDDSIKPTVADSDTTEYTVIFTPTDTINYRTVNGKTTLTVIKQTPNFTEEQIESIEATAITYGQSLGDSTITGDSPVFGSFSWKDVTIRPSVPDSDTTEYEIIFTPEDTDNYNEVELTTTIHVNKATPVISALNASDITYGQSLSDSSLTVSASVPGSVKWESPTIKPTAPESNRTEYWVIFTPTDTVNYNIVKTKKTLVINKKDPPFTPAQLASINATGITYGQSLSDSVINGDKPIPGDFDWVSGSIKPVVADSNITKYNVVFTPQDTDNYNNYTLTLSLPVAKAKPIVTVLSTEGITYEQSLSDSAIEYRSSVLGSVAWENDTIKPTVPDSNTTGYKVVFTPQDTENYEVVIIEAPVQVAKATPVVEDIKATDITYGQTLEDSEITFTASTSGDVTWYARQGSSDTVIPAVSDSDSTYYRVLFTPTDTVNYNNVIAEIQITVHKQTPSFTQEQIITATGITYGQALKDSVLTGDSPVSGTFAWENDSIVPTVADSETTEYNVVFTPTDTDNYNSKTITSTLKVNKAMPSVENLSASGLVYEQSLADSVITFNASVSGSVAWEDDTVKPAVSDSDSTEYKIIFTPDDTLNYKNVEEKVTVNVIKNTPEVTNITASEITYNQSLSDSIITGDCDISGVYEWDDETIVPSVSDSGTTIYDLLFTPDDTDNYNSVSLSVKVKVNKDTPTIEGSLETTEITYGEALNKSQITGVASIEGDFEWKEPETKPDVSDSNNTLYDVIFKPADSSNYNDVELTAYVKVLKADVLFTEAQFNSIEASEITYGQSLGNSSITGESPITGHFEWVNPSDIPTVNDSIRRCKFIPDDTDNYNEFEFNLKAPVDKADPEIPEVHGTTITYGQKLKESEIICSEPIEGTFVWKEPDSMPSATTNDTFTAIFTPNDTDNYNIIEVEVPVIVNKASVNISVADIEKTYGDAPFDLGAVSVGTITYTSSNPEIITIEGNNGVIKGAGVAVITATAYLNDNYETAIADFIVTVKQAIPEIKSVYPERPLMYGESLADIDLVGEATVLGQFKWTNEEYCPEYSDNGSEFGVTFIPDDNGYATITKDVELTVVQKDPEIPEEEIFELSSTKLVYGQSLKHSTIVGERRYPGEYEWYEPDTIPNVADSNVTEYAVIFVPEDNNYATVIIGGLTVEVEKAQVDAPDEDVVKQLDEGKFELQDELESDGERVYTSSDTSIATVDSSGVVTPLRKGETDITITALETDNYLECYQVYHLKVMYNAPSNDILDYSGASFGPFVPVVKGKDIIEDEETIEEADKEEVEIIDEIDEEHSDDKQSNNSKKNEDEKDRKENKEEVDGSLEEYDDAVPTGVALGGIGTLITSLIAMAIFKKRR